MKKAGLRNGFRKQGADAHVGTFDGEGALVIDVVQALLLHSHIHES